MDNKMQQKNPMCTSVSILLTFSWQIPFVLAFRFGVYYLLLGLSNEINANCFDYSITLEMTKLAKQFAFIFLNRLSSFLNRVSCCVSQLSYLFNNKMNAN